MKFLLHIIVAAALIALYYLTNYPDRIREYNFNICLIYGYKADCSTPLNNVIQKVR
jgi:hypothetical protein